jgi:hypothetical protein
VNLTKDELRCAAMQELNVSKNSFDFAWIDAIEKTGPSRLIRALAPTAARQKLASPLSFMIVFRCLDDRVSNPS